MKLKLSYDECLEIAKKAGYSGAQAKKKALETFEQQPPIVSGKLPWEYIFVAVICIAFLVYVFDGDRQEANRKAFEERQRGNSTFCNPASGVCYHDPDGKKRKQWNDALESASGK